MFVKMLRGAMLMAAAVATPAWAAMLHLSLADPTGAPVPGANVVLPDGRGAASDLEGMAVLHGVAGRLGLTITCVGFAPLTLHLDLPDEGHITHHVVLRPTEVELQDLTITARRGSGIDLGAERATEVLSVDEAAARSLDGTARGALGSLSGVDTRPCGLCGSAGVGLQGLDPNYTEVRLDGLAVMSGVGALYGMDAVGVSTLSSLAVTRGAVTAAEGSGAVAGGVSLSSRRPDGEDTFQLRLALGDGWRHGAGFSAGRTLAGLPLLLNADWQADPQRLDRNGDQLTDTPQVKRLGGQLSLGRSSHAFAWNVHGSGLREQRFAGDTGWEASDRGSSQVYGRDIAIRRAELRASMEGVLDERRSWSMAAAIVQHHQDSWYGPTAFDATQRRLLLQAGLDLRGAGGALNRLQAGWTDDLYEDGLPLPTDRHDRVPSFSYSRLTTAGRWIWEGGLRAEKQEEGWIPLGRGSVALQAHPDLLLRVSLGQGYRQVTLFSLDKAVHAGFDNVELPDRLKPERSLSLNLGLQHQRVGSWGRWQGNVSLFAVEFREKAILRYTEEVGTLRYGNAREAFSRGVEARADWLGMAGWHLAAGGTVSRVQLLLDEGWRAEELAGSWTASALVGKRGLAGLPGLGAELRLRATGPQEMPVGRGRDKTPAWSVLDLGLEHDLGSWTLGLDVENLLDYVQPDNPLVIDAGHEGMLDAALIYGPLIGRRFRLRAALDM
jgi:outer membrane receptor for ferrienterochelin and colicins